MASQGKRRLRRSQGVMTFGPGAILDLSDESVMMAGIEFWPEDRYVEVHEPGLERLLRVDGFRMPPVSAERDKANDMPIVLFPKWVVCPRCNRLAPWEVFAGGMLPPNGIIRCPTCNKRVFPARLVIACEHGHIDDFPWVKWAHRDNEAVCDRPELRLYSMGITASLSDMRLSVGCGAKTTLGGATQRDQVNDIGREMWRKPAMAQR